MLVFLCGPDTFSSQKKLDGMIEDYKKAHKKSLALKIFGGEDFDFKDLVSEIGTNSMFGDKKLLILKNIFSNKKFKEDFLEQGKKLIKTDVSIVFHETGEIDKRDRFVKFLQENADFQEFQLLEGEKLAAWAEKKIKSYGAEIAAKALKKLIIFTGNDLWRLENEVMKLVCHAENKKIKEEDIDLLVGPKIDNDIFETIDSLAEQKKDLALSLLHKHLEKGDSPLYLLSMISFQFRNLLAVRDLTEKKTPYYEIAKKSGLHPFVVKKTYWQAQKFSLSQLKKIYQSIFQIDLAIKTGKIGQEAALDLFVAGI